MDGEQQARTALSQQLAAQSGTASRPDLGLLLSLEAVRLAPESRYAQGSLLTGLVLDQDVQIVLDG